MPAMSGYEAFSTIYAGRGGNGSTNRCYLRLNFRRNQPKAEKILQQTFFKRIGGCLFFYKNKQNGDVKTFQKLLEYSNLECSRGFQSFKDGWFPIESMKEGIRWNVKCISFLTK